MDCDRSWMHIKGIQGRKKEEYKKGVEEFLDFASKEVIQESNAKIRCPCLQCLNNFFQDKSVVRRHLFQYGVDPGYNLWIYHGEENSPMDDDVDVDQLGENFEDDFIFSSDMASLVHDATNVVVGCPTLDQESAQQGCNHQGYHHQTEMPAKFKRLMKAAEEELYQGCKTYSKLEFIVTLLNLKVSNHWSDKSFTESLSALHRAFNYDSNFPKSSFEAKKYTNDLGLNYEKIDACVNHCVLYRKEYANATQRPICHEPRWQTRGKDVNDTGSSSICEEDSKRKSKVSRLVVRHANGKLDEEAELKLLKFQELHEREIREKGVDNLSVQEAFVEVLGYRSGYARGLGKGAPAVPKGKKTMAALECDLQQLRSRENELLEKVRRMEVEAREREERREEEMRLREDRIREELNAEMQKKMDQFMNVVQAKLG